MTVTLYYHVLEGTLLGEKKRLTAKVDLTVGGRSGVNCRQSLNGFLFEP